LLEVDEVSSASTGGDQFVEASCSERAPTTRCLSFFVTDGKRAQVNQMNSCASNGSDTYFHAMQD
jgi:hypothetical protein